MPQRFLKHKRFGWIALFSLCLVLNSNSCKQPERSTVLIAVEVTVGKEIKQNPFQAAISRFEAQLAQDVAEDGVGSISAGVVVGNDVVWAKGFGWADIEKQTPADEETIYRTGSISKSFTAVLMVQMVEKGYFKLDDPVEKYFPEINNLADRPEGAKPITFRHLASHTSGLSREPNLKDAASGPISQWEDKILASIPKTSYLSPPEERYSYSNIGFGILGLAVSRAVGKPFMDLVQEHIFSPLAMTSSFFILTENHIPHLAMGYVKRGDGTLNAEFPAKEHAGRGYKVPNGGIYSTVGDLAKFVAAMTGSSSARIFSEETRNEILSRQTPEGGGGYGLGFTIRTDEEGFTSAGHGGSVAGYNASMVFHPESKIGVVVFRNYNRGKTNLGRSTRDLLKELASAEASK
ncbi:MAG: serine hydrolase [Candidatus Aminicenantes bacterium]|nr:serine hydrolase [Candidatus Aminicenantes bacterium]